MLLHKETHGRKRERPSTFPEDNEPPPDTKRRKRNTHNYPPEVWDNLSKITLTRKALQEFDRRTLSRKTGQTVRPLESIPRLLRSDTRQLEEFASNGRPDLSKLRGVSMVCYPE